MTGELLALAEALIRGGVHPSEIISGYTLSHRKLQEILPGTRLCFSGFCLLGGELVF